MLRKAFSSDRVFSTIRPGVQYETMPAMHARLMASAVDQTVSVSVDPLGESAHSQAGRTALESEPEAGHKAAVGIVRAHHREAELRRTTLIQNPLRCPGASRQESRHPHIRAPNPRTRSSDVSGRISGKRAADTELGRSNSEASPEIADDAQCERACTRKNAASKYGKSPKSFAAAGSYCQQGLVMTAR